MNRFAIAFTPAQLDTLSSAWTDLANSDRDTVQGMVDRINGLETFLYDPGFKYNATYIGYFHLFIGEKNTFLK